MSAEVFKRNGMWLAPGEWGGPAEGEELETRTVRYRTVGDMSCTGAVESTASTPDEVLAEISISTLSRARRHPAPMTNFPSPPWRTCKKEGYFSDLTTTLTPNVGALKQRDTLRLCTAGSVDDGKSTFVGRLLYDTKSVLADQVESMERTSTDRGFDGMDLSLLVDGLRAEREQGITIDVAYRYFAHG